MQITLTIKDKTVKSAIAGALEASIFDIYDPAVIKMAKLPKITAKVDEIFADAKFQAVLAKRLTTEAESMLEEYIFDELVFEMNVPGTKDMVKKCDDAYEQMQAKKLADKEAEEMKRLIKNLEKSGFKIVKA